MDNSRASWAEIDLGAIRRNIKAIRKLLDSQTMLMTVVKANAYGHGMVKVAQACVAEGAAYLGVATLEEALDLRANNIRIPIQVLGFISADYAELAVSNHIDVSIFDLENAKAYSRVASPANPARLHIKIDTGMGRIGFQDKEDAAAIIAEISSLPNISLQGIFTHLAVADSADKADKDFTMQQIETFNNFVKRLEDAGIYIPIKHIANSAAIMDLPAAQCNMVRAGIITYGLYPSDQVQKEILQLIPAMRLKTRISHLKVLPPGRSVSYGRTYFTLQETLVATVPIGYADGYNRLFSNRAWASLNGQQIPLIGTVCMDQCMFDVSGVEGVKTGDEVILFGRPEDGITADDLAELAGTINYEIVCSIAARISRVYIE